MGNLYKKIEDLCFYKKRQSVGAMCDAIGISRTTMSNLKVGKTNGLRENTLRKIAEYLEVEPEELADAETEIIYEATPLDVPPDMVGRLVRYAVMLSNREVLCDLVEEANGLSDNQVDVLIAFLKGLRHGKNTDTD